MVSGFILFISKLGIASLVAFCTYVFLSYNPYHYSLHFIFLTVVLAGLTGLLIAIAFLGVFHLTIDTIFLCFLQDCEVNDGSAERPYYMSDSLKRIVNKANKVGSLIFLHCYIFLFSIKNLHVNTKTDGSFR